MQLQLVLASEALATSLTGEGPLPGVSADVSVEVRHSSKLGLTVCAGIGPDAVMNLKKIILKSVSNRNAFICDTGERVSDQSMQHEDCRRR